MTTADMFPDLKPPRAKPRKLMHVVDCGNANCGGLEDGEQLVQFECARCGHKSDWLVMPNVTTAKRGVPCPVCVR